MVARDRFGRFVAGDARWKYGAHNVRHGHSRAARRSKTYCSWHSMICRSRGQGHKAYAGVAVC